MNAAASGANNGTSWRNAYTDLPDSPGGRNGGPADLGRGRDLQADRWDPTAPISFVKPGVGVDGGFAGTETALEQRDWRTNVTTLSGDLLGNDSGMVDPDNITMADDSYHVVVNNATGSGTILDGFTITGGNANNTSNQSGEDGGGIAAWRAI